MTSVLGIDIGASKALSCVTDESGEVLLREKRPTGRDSGPERIMAIVREAWRSAERQGLRCVAVGIAFPGLVDHGRGVVLSSVMLEGWSDVALGTSTTDALGVPCAVDNDVNAAALAELCARAPATPRCMLMVMVGTGIGGAVCIDGALFRGASGVSGEIGNTSVDPRGEPCWCGRRGCLNVYSSGSAIERLSRSMGKPAAIEGAARALGLGLANAVQLLNPDLIVVGGGVAELGEAYLGQVRDSLAGEVFPEAWRACRLEPARAGYDAAALGACLLARQRVV